MRRADPSALLPSRTCLERLARSRGRTCDTAPHLRGDRNTSPQRRSAKSLVALRVARNCPAQDQREMRPATPLGLRPLVGTEVVPPRGIPRARPTSRATTTSHVATGRAEAERWDRRPTLRPLPPGQEGRPKRQGAWPSAQIAPGDARWRRVTPTDGDARDGAGASAFGRHRVRVRLRLTRPNSLLDALWATLTDATPFLRAPTATCPLGHALSSRGRGRHADR
jgi:hypothetical protein